MRHKKNKKNKKNIIWCITGAGQFLEESYKFIKKLNERGDYDVTVVFSGAGYEVLGMYGLGSIKNYVKNLILEENQGMSSPFCGQLSKKDYDFVVVAPATANTVSKIVYGIADTLVTNIVAQAGKTNTPVFVLPTDAEKVQETKIPMSIDNEKCGGCEYNKNRLHYRSRYFYRNVHYDKNCPCVAVCPNNAIFTTEKGILRINLMLCNACKCCISACKYNAITFGKIVNIKCRDIDIENVEKLMGIKGINVVKNLDEIILHYYEK